METIIPYNFNLLNGDTFACDICDQHNITTPATLSPNEIWHDIPPRILHTNGSNIHNIISPNLCRRIYICTNHAKTYKPPINNCKTCNHQQKPLTIHNK